MGGTVMWATILRLFDELDWDLWNKTVTNKMKWKINITE
jgi:hypothetical protein